MQHSTATFDALDGTTIFTQQWFPDGFPRALVLLIHGYAEHSGRYTHVARYLTEHEYAVCALDHRGHGHSSGTRAQIKRFADYVTDLRIFFDQIKDAYPNLPVFLYGHSMGSLIGLLFAFQYQDGLAGLITTGVSLKIGAANPALIVTAKLLNVVLSNARLLPPLDANAISRDPAVVRRYDEDPLVYRGRISIGFGVAVQRAAEQCIELLPTLRLPYLTLHGSLDNIVLVEGTEIVREQSGSPDTTVKIYEGLYHEVHNEPEQDQVLGYITGWLDAHLV